jgi:hypothetical protein
VSPHVHIICAEAPWPVDNSIAIDIFYKIEALHKAGIKIHLHYFYTNSGCHPTELNKYCESISSYQTGKSKNGFIVNSCEGDDKLAAIINNDNHPVIFEGLKSTGVIHQIEKLGRKIIVRMHNDECRHYHHLEKTSSSFFEKFRLKRNTSSIKKYEDSLPKNCLYAFSNKADVVNSKQDHHLINANHLPVFSPFKTVTSKTGIGNFCLYHGNLSDPSNEKAALWLLSKVYNDIQTPLVITGKNPGRQLVKQAELYTHTCLIENPSTTEMEDLIGKAQINVLPSFSYKKPELKLTHALLSGRHCVVNENAVAGTEYETTCHVGKTASAFKSIILQLYHRPFEEEEIELREKLFRSINTEKPVEMLIEWLYS